MLIGDNIVITKKVLIKMIMMRKVMMKIGINMTRIPIVLHRIMLVAIIIYSIKKILILMGMLIKVEIKKIRISIKIKI